MQPKESSTSAFFLNQKGAVFIIILAFILIIAVAVSLFFFWGKFSKLTIRQPNKIEPARFAHFKYLPKPKFEKTVSSSFAQPNEYKVKGNLPSAQEVIKKSKISLIPVTFAGGETNLPVYRASRHQVTKEDATSLASKFGITGEPSKLGSSSQGTPIKLENNTPADTYYFAWFWETQKEYFEISKGLGSGYEYYLKGPALSGNAPSDEEVKSRAKEFLTQKGLIDDSYFISGIHYNVSDISKRTGFREDHKQVYFRKKIQGYQVYDWVTGGGSPIADKIEVWVGVDGRILYVSDSSFWTTIDKNNKTDYLLKEPTDAFENIKMGKGKLAWVDWDAIDVATGGYGPSAPGGNFDLHGRLKNVEIEAVDLAYYHQQESIETPEFYQPIYLFKAQATLDWKDDYTPDGGGEEFLRGKRTTVTFVVPATPENFFFEYPITLAQGGVTQPSAPVPVYYPPVQQSPTLTPTTGQAVIPTNPPQQEKQSFILKLGVVTPLDDPKRNVYLGWEDVPGTVKYNIYLKIAGDQDYSQAALLGTGSFSETVGVNKYIDYYFKVQACTASRCIDSNEVFLPQEQKATFYMKLGIVTPGEDPKTEVTLSWSEYPGTVKYNVFLRNSQTEAYTTALAGTGELSYTTVVNRHNDNYFIVQACNNEACFPSNEIFLPKK